MKSIVKINSIFGLLCGLALGAITPAWSGQDALETDITLTRLGESQWRADYRFSAPVDALAVFPGQLSFRAKAWHLRTPGMRLEEGKDNGVIRSTDGPFDALSLEFVSDADFDDKTYVPVLPFSDGGAAVYTGHFSGDLLRGEKWVESATTFRLIGREGEQTLLPALASERQPVYAYRNTF